jgi:hypothetical protein
LRLVNTRTQELFEISVIFFVLEAADIVFNIQIRAEVVVSRSSFAETSKVFKTRNSSKGGRITNLAT